jgi:hypothetical protein
MSPQLFGQLAERIAGLWSYCVAISPVPGLG